MSAKWTSNALTGSNGMPDSGISLGEQFVVLLLYGKNTFGDKIYSYLKITLSDLQRLKSAIQAGQGFNPSDFGTVVAAGRGDPSEETKAEIAATYNVLAKLEQVDDAADETSGDAFSNKKKAWDEY